MKVRELIKALQSLKDDENAKIAECDVMIYCEETLSDKEVANAMSDYDFIVSRVERDADNAAPEVTLYVKKQ